LAGPRGAFQEHVAALEKLHGRPLAPLPRDPFEWILWENVAYLVDDERRSAAYRALARATGLRADRIAKATPRTLRAVTALGGMHPDARADRLREIAELALSEASPDLAHVLQRPIAQARKILRKFPGIGAPGADRILLLCGALRELALESNGLRVVIRLGYGQEKPSYAATYKSALEALAPELPRDAAWLARAHDLLRTHGRTLCKRSAPDCDACPLAPRCRFAAGAGRAG
jgi:endonuclease III